ncbi:hypothetical protein [Flavobacterium aquidurense]|jgi:hypothetical protein|uniref:hypothetical protein n=1 Tax=Flavobacterium aquidurense TaxID=362413 RepID=UPI000921DA6A|nr:hypothetical protein [Flavobacterium aquidurense]SHG25743.1 hypothetical protein SAMN05444481_103128 [Flavobacterium frigidimaris]
MKKITLLLICLQLMSCAFPTYVTQDQKMQSGLDFNNGKWLLNTIDAPYFVSKKLTKIVIEDFNKQLKKDLSYVPLTKGLLLPPNISFNPDRKELTDLKEGTKFDYFINIKAKVVKEEIAAVDYSSHNNLSQEHHNEIVFVLEIYDLNNLEVIYSKTINGSVAIDKNSNNLILAKTTDGLILGAYKKIKKDINKKSL